MASFATPHMDMEEFKTMMRGFIGEAVRDELMPVLTQYVNENVVRSAREAARCALTDEIDFITERANELYGVAAKTKTPPSQMK